MLRGLEVAELTDEHFKGAIEWFVDGDLAADDGDFSSARWFSSGWSARSLEPLRVRFQNVSSWSRRAESPASLRR